MDFKFKQYKLYLGIIDNLHDFYKSDVYKDKKDKCEFLFNNLFTFINVKYKDYIIEQTNEIMDSYKKINVNTQKTKEDIYKIIINYCKPEQISLTEIHALIIKNFNILFNVNGINNIKVNLNTLISDNQKILLRQLLYFLIKTKDEQILDFILKYCNLDIYTDNVNKKIKLAVLNNLISNKFDNKTYPITYFDDMSGGLNIKYNRYHILNLDKNNVDSSYVISKDTYIDKFDFGTLTKNTITDTDKYIGFKLTPIDKHYFLDVVYYIEDKHIICNYNGIKFIINKNNAGRSDETGIYQVTTIIVDIFIKCYHKLVLLHKKEINLLLKKEIELNKNSLESVIDITNLHNQLYTIYIKYKTIDMCIGCIVFLLFGFKRFGDWIQVELSSKLYLTLQTKDYYCQLYGIFVGAPTIIDEDIYNYNPKEDLLLDNFMLFNKNTTTVIKPTDKLIYTGLRDIETNNISRHYFSKYVKYKAKYLQLKNNTVIN